MPVNVIEPPAEPEVLRKTWTREEYGALCETGLLPKRLELIEGEIIRKPSKNQPHMIAGVRLHKWLVGIFGFDNVLPNGSVDVSPEDNPTSLPEPDLVVLSRDIAQIP